MVRLGRFAVRFEKAKSGDWTLNNSKGDVFRIRMGVIQETRPEGTVVNLILGAFSLDLGLVADRTQEVGE